IEADTALMRELMRRASRIVLNSEPNGPYELRTKANIVRYPDRFSDPRGEAIWQRVLALLEPDPKGAGRLSSAVIHRAGINRAGDSACGRESIEQSIVSLASAFPAI